MNAVDLKPPTNEEAMTLCKVGQGYECCRYLTMSGKGWSCEKNGELAPLLDYRVLTETITARGNNCPGKGSQ